MYNDFERAMKTRFHEAILWEKLPNSLVRCHVCQWRCRIQPGKLGVCRMRQNVDGVMQVLNYARASSMAADPIEKKPLFHFYPGSLVFSLGSWGCNFHCRHCQNWQISFGTPDDALKDSQEVLPEKAMALTQRYGCAGLAWTYNEPGIWLEYTLDSARLAKAQNLYTVYVTNGYLTPEALDTMGPYLDAFRVDVKGFSDAFYQDLARVKRWQGVLEVTQRAKKKWDMHVEIVTNVIPTLNDDEAQLSGIAGWIAEALGENTPWHVTRFYPHHELSHLPPTPVATLERAVALGQRAGLHFVYLGNVPGHEREHTFCYSCGRQVIQRVGYHTQIVGLEGGHCHFCGADLNLRTSATPRRAGFSLS